MGCGHTADSEVTVSYNMSSFDGVGTVRMLASEDARSLTPAYASNMSMPVPASAYAAGLTCDKLSLAAWPVGPGALCSQSGKCARQAWSSEMGRAA